MQRRHTTRNTLKLRQQELWHLKYQIRIFERRVEAKLFGRPTLVVHAQTNSACDVVEAACGLGLELGGDESNSLVEGPGSLGYIDAVDVV